jgi:apolipoprotein N-acyltransferase
VAAALVRCCNNGISGWIDAQGRVREIFRDARGNEYGAGAMTVEIPLRNADEKFAPTFYTRHGDWFGWSCVILTVARLVGRIFMRRKFAKRLKVD